MSQVLKNRKSPSKWIHQSHRKTKSKNLGFSHLDLKSRRETQWLVRVNNEAQREGVTTGCQNCPEAPTRLIPTETVMSTFKVIEIASSMMRVTTRVSWKDKILIAVNHLLTVWKVPRIAVKVWNLVIGYARRLRQQTIAPMKISTT